VHENDAESAPGPFEKTPLMISFGVSFKNPSTGIVQPAPRIGASLMNKSELVQSLADKISVSAEEAALIVDTFFDSMREAMLRGDRIEIRGFGSFKIKQYDGYIGRNPKTGESVQVKPKKMPFFKAGKGLLDYLNE
jgi:integration host factor subunit beta